MTGRLVFFALVAVGLMIVGINGVAADGVGVVLMHGKDGSAKSGSPTGKLASKLEGEFEVKATDMPWSRSNGFDKTLEECFAKIDNYVEGLRDDGATKIVVGGHSLGAAVALAYATRRPGLAGVLLMAPGHRPDLLASENEAALSKAKALIGKGDGNDEVRIFDVNQGRKITRSLEADVAVGFFDPGGLAVMQNAAPKVSPGTPVLWIIGEKDRLHPKGRSLIYDKIPDNPKSAYVVVPGGHRATPTKGAKKIKEWLDSL
ncbi:MAG: alpha/beta hydrolase [Rhodospirillales bacterium]|jgi:pimeloyl-ACP methyl ester carboxylesterase|nr:alpha/beta hydrolase [Rhodospirillales bacterium]